LFCVRLFRAAAVREWLHAADSIFLQQMYSQSLPQCAALFDCHCGVQINGDAANSHACIAAQPVLSVHRTGLHVGPHPFTVDGSAHALLAVVIGRVSHTLLHTCHTAMLRGDNVYTHALQLFLHGIAACSKLDVLPQKTRCQQAHMYQGVEHGFIHLGKTGTGVSFNRERCATGAPTVAWTVL
jgi:hypothetical protein